MCLLVFLLTLFYFVTAVVKGKVDLEITKIVNGNQSSVLSSIEAKNEASFSLMCRVVDARNGEKLTDGVLWTKKRGKSEFWNAQGLEMPVKNIVSAANLTFTSVTEENQGEYLCLSLKYRLLKAVHVKIVPEMSQGGFDLHFPVKRRMRSSNNHVVGFVNPPPADTYSRSDLNVEQFAPGQTLDLVKDEHLDVKKVKLTEENGRNETNIFKYHDGTTNVFRIGLLVSFVFLLLLGIYRIIKCWRAGELGMFNNRASRVTPSSAVNNQSPESDSCEMIIIRPGQTEVLTAFNRDTNIGSTLLNGGVQNGSIENMLDLLAQQRAASFNKTDDLPPPYEQVVSNSAPGTPQAHSYDAAPTAPPKNSNGSGNKSKDCNN